MKLFKIITLTLVMLNLWACSNENSESIKSTPNSYQNGTVNFKVPQGWQVITPQELPEGVVQGTDFYRVTDGATRGVIQLRSFEGQDKAESELLEALFNNLYEFGIVAGDEMESEEYESIRIFSGNIVGQEEDVEAPQEIWVFFAPVIEDQEPPVQVLAVLLSPAESEVPEEWAINTKAFLELIP